MHSTILPTNLSASPVFIIPLAFLSSYFIISHLLIASRATCTLPLSICIFPVGIHSTASTPWVSHRNPTATLLGILHHLLPSSFSWWHEGPLFKQPSCTLRDGSPMHVASHWLLQTGLPSLPPKCPPPCIPTASAQGHILFVGTTGLEPQSLMNKLGTAEGQRNGKILRTFQPADAKHCQLHPGAFLCILSHLLRVPRALCIPPNKLVKEGLTAAQMERNLVTHFLLLSGHTLPLLSFLPPFRFS